MEDYNLEETFRRLVRQTADNQSGRRRHFIQLWPAGMPGTILRGFLVFGFEHTIS